MEEILMRGVTRKWPLLALLAGVAVMALPPPARADFELKIYDDGTLVGGGPIVSQDGHTIAYAASTADFAITGGFALSNSPGANNLGTISISNLSVNYTATDSAPHSLTLELSANGFMVPVSPPFILSSSVSYVTVPMAQNASGSVSFQSFVDTNNQMFASGGPGVYSTNLQSSAVDNGTLTNAGALATQQTLFSGSVPYSLMDRTVLTFDSSGVMGMLGATAVATPAPAGLMLALTGLPVLGFGLGWRRLRRRA
jgi:hypothetical protein